MRATKVNVLVKYRNAKRVMVHGSAVRLLSDAEIREVRSYVDSERSVRIKRGEPVAQTKTCRGCELPFPRTLDFFHCRIRKGHSDYWNPFCRKCRRARRDRKVTP
jgi:hypothetical protein